MRLRLDPRLEPAAVLELSRAELPIFKAAIERASFIDTRPEIQAAVFDFIERLLAQLPEDPTDPGGAPAHRGRP